MYQTNAFNQKNNGITVVIHFALVQTFFTYLSKYFLHFLIFQNKSGLLVFLKIFTVSGQKHQYFCRWLTLTLYLQAFDIQIFLCYICDFYVVYNIFQFDWDETSLPALLSKHKLFFFKAKLSNIFKKNTGQYIYRVYHQFCSVVHAVNKYQCQFLAVTSGAIGEEQLIPEALKLFYYCSLKFAASFLHVM